MFYTDGWLRNSSSSCHEYAPHCEKIRQGTSRHGDEYDVCQDTDIFSFEHGHLSYGKCKKKLQPLVSVLDHIEINELPAPYGL